MFPLFFGSWRKENVLVKLFKTAFLFCFVFVHFSTGGRAGWLGLLIGGLFLAKKLTYFPQIFRKRSVLTVSLIFGILLFLLWFKRDSTAGRILIYKISTHIFKANWLWGVGWGNFKIAYNHYQADYFTKHDIDTKEALLADNSFYAFNDSWQLLIEVGIVRFVLLSILLMMLFFYFKNYQIKPHKMPLFYGASAALLCLIVASLFSYPFQVFGVQILALVYVELLFFSLQEPGHMLRETKWPLLLAKATFGAGLLFCSYYGFNKFFFFERSKEAFELSRSGFKKAALNAYSDLRNSDFRDGSMLFSYAIQLYNANQLTKAKEVLTEAKHYYVDNEMYKLSAAITEELGDPEQAHKDYLTALYMVPNRMRSRYDLMVFYLKQKDTARAFYWGKSILRMPVKIPSPITASLLRSTKKLFGGIKNKGAIK